MVQVAQLAREELQVNLDQMVKKDRKVKPVSKDPRDNKEYRGQRD